MPTAYLDALCFLIHLEASHRAGNEPVASPKQNYLYCSHFKILFGFPLDLCARLCGLN
jgi:hypothetical protein